MQKFFQWMIRYKLLIIALFTAIALFGWKAYRDIPIDAFPDITPKQVVIYTESPGNSAEDIEKLITYPIESAMAGLPGVRMILSNSIFGLSYVSIFFEDAYDLYFLRQLVSERLSGIEIPDGWGKPVMGPNTTGLGQVFWYRLHDTKGHYTLSELRAMQRYIVAPLLKSVDGVEEVIGWGGFEKQYEVRIDPKRLQALDVTYDDILEALQGCNQNAGGQYMEINKEQYLIRGDGFFKDLSDIERCVVKTNEAMAVTIGNIAQVAEGSAPRFGAVSFDGNETMFGMVLQRSGTNAAKVVEQIKAKIPTLNKALPKGVRIQSLYDRTEITHKAVTTMTQALFSGAILVAIILFLFLFELRSALIVILSLPLSLLIAFLLMQRYGISANLMSLSGLAIAIGMIVDGTIVVVENAFRLLHEKPDLPKAELIAVSTAEVAKPVLFALLIIMAVFIPLLTLTGLAGKLYAPMAIDIVFVMIGALLVALGLVPVLSYLLLKAQKSAESPLMRLLKKLYHPLLSLTLRHAKVVVGLTFILFLFLAWRLSQQGEEFMPKLNEESIMYRVIAIPGTALSQSIANAQRIETYLKQTFGNHVDHVLSMIGRSEKGETAQSNYMEILVLLKNNTQNLPALERRMSAQLQRHFPYLQFIPTQPIAMRIEELLEGIKAELAIKIFGDNQRTMQRIADEVVQTLQGVRGLERVEIETQLGQAQLVIRPDTLALSRYGITTQSLMRLIRFGLGEESITQKLEGVRRFGVVAKIEGAKKSIDALYRMTIRAKDGKVVPLKDLCTIEIRQGPSFIKRENLSRYMVISMEVEKRDIAGFVKEADGKIAQNVKIPNGYYLRWAGDFKNMQEATKRLALIIPATLLLIVLLLYTAFNDLKKVAVILLGVPLGLIGAIAALLIADLYLSVSAIVGFIAIFAIATLNGIVLVSFIETLQSRFEEVPLLQLLTRAATMRLRPVLMTAMTTLFGILPLLWATGVGSEVQYPLAVVVTGGVISSTLLTLLVLPALYLLFSPRTNTKGA